MEIGIRKGTRGGTLPGTRGGRAAEGEKSSPGTERGNALGGRVGAGRGNHYPRGVHYPPAGGRSSRPGRRPIGDEGRVGGAAAPVRAAPPRLAHSRVIHPARWASLLVAPVPARSNDASRQKSRGQSAAAASRRRPLRSGYSGYTTNAVAGCHRRRPRGSSAVQDAYTRSVQFSLLPRHAAIQADNDSGGRVP